ncbi:hypothetical protein BGZ63DRAFT_397905 [Mariannaea sp. PMI_226]|nr:hypothetical protein BGZ63DRAFT_397905 [Mariannaea sp. PMI_226]
MSEDFELPYFAPESRLPAPLPKLEAISEYGEILQEYTGRCVVRFAKCYIIKYGLNVSLTEGLNMLFAHRKHITMVPEVFALYSVKNKDGRCINYIIMENIIGEGLDVMWNGMGCEEKEQVLGQLRDGLDVLRGIPSPGYFGCIGRQPFEESMFWTSAEGDVKDGSISGPFDTESQLIDAFVKKYLYYSGLVHKAEYYRRVLPLVLSGHRSIFSHGDLQRKNIMVKEDGGLVIIDWEAAGWYPEYWEYALAMFACGSWEDDWHESVGKILDEYPNEYAWFEMLRRELWS